jgi:hypothetical protein
MLLMANPATELRDLTRVQIYMHFIETGRAPTTADIAVALNPDAADVEQAINDLADAHTIVLAPGTRSIWMAHPFSAVPTLYPVVRGGTSYWANCAWDAYGIAAMIDRDTRCVAPCPDCGQQMDLSIKRGAVSTTDMVHFVVPPRRFWDNVAFT